MRYHEVIADANQGRLPLWTIILDPSVQQAMEKLEYVEKLGYVGAEVVTPMVQLRSDEEIYDYFKYLSDHSDLAIVFYRSAVTGKLISFDLSRKLADLETIVGMKQGSSNHGDTLKLRKMIRDDFIVADPIESYWLDDLRRGGQVLYGAFNHIVYGKKRHLMEEYTALARQGKWEEANEKWEELEPARDLLDQVMFIPTFSTFTYASTLALMKVWYEAIGLAAGPVRPPIRQVTSEQREWLMGELKRVGVI
jgi:4-hydroxy-tetrahydrodipicolinate synthase